MQIQLCPFLTRLLSGSFIKILLIILNKQTKEQDLRAENSASGPLLSTWHALSHLILQQMNEEGIRIMPILETETLSVEEAEYFTQGRRAGGTAGI